MKMPSPTWKTEYRCGRRKHRHRCHVCHKIIQPGETVLMARIKHNKTKAIHEGCGDAAVDGMTMAERFEYWGLEYLAAVGYREAQKRRDEIAAQWRAA